MAACGYGNNFDQDMGAQAQSSGGFLGRLGFNNGKLSYGNNNGAAASHGAMGMGQQAQQQTGASWGDADNGGAYRVMGFEDGQGDDAGFAAGAAQNGYQTVTPAQANATQAPCLPCQTIERKGPMVERKAQKTSGPDCGPNGPNGPNCKDCGELRKTTRYQMIECTKNTYKDECQKCVTKTTVQVPDVKPVTKKHTFSVRVPRVVAGPDKTIMVDKCEVVKGETKCKPQKKVVWKKKPVTIYINLPELVDDEPVCVTGTKCKMIKVPFSVPTKQVQWDNECKTIEYQSQEKTMKTEQRDVVDCKMKRICIPKTTVHKQPIPVFTWVPGPKPQCKDGNCEPEQKTYA